MPSLPRIITVDVSGTIARIVRAASDLTDRSVRILDVPSGPDALEELKTGGCDLIVSAWELYDSRMRGLQLAIQAAQIAPKVGVILLGDVDDPDPTDELVNEESPFIYMRRPVDIHQFVRVLMAGLEGGDMRAALNAPVAGAAPMAANFGPVPTIDLKRAQAIIDPLLPELKALAITLATRTGETLMVRGQVAGLNLDEMTHNLLPLVMTTITMKDMVGGSSALQFFDGVDYDIFVLSVGLHHFICVICDGKEGAKMFGAVNRWGRKACEDLIAVIGAEALIIRPPVLEDDAAREEERHDRRRKTARIEVIDEDPVPLARAQELVAHTPAPEPEALRLAPIPDLDVSIFDALSDLNDAEMEDLFDIDKMAELVSNVEVGVKDDKLSLEEAERIGIMGSNQ